MLINLQLCFHIGGFIVVPCDYQRYICRPIIIDFKLLIFHVS